MLTCLQLAPQTESLTLLTPPRVLSQFVCLQLAPLMFRETSARHVWITDPTPSSRTQRLGVRFPRRVAVPDSDGTLGSFHRRAAASAYEGRHKWAGSAHYNVTQKARLGPCKTALQRRVDKCQTNRSSGLDAANRPAWRSISGPASLRST